MYRNEREASLYGFTCAPLAPRRTVARAPITIGTMFVVVVNVATVVAFLFAVSMMH